MKVYVVFCHPNRSSFTGQVLDAFHHGLRDAGHCVEIGDLYEMDFKSDMDITQFVRETTMNLNTPQPDDILVEQHKIDSADGLVFIYPVWWSDCPAKLKGWFDRVFTYGYAYFYDDRDNRGTKIDIKKALVLCPAGHTNEHLEEIGITESMRHVMLDDRLIGVGVGEARMEILGGLMGGNDNIRRVHLEKAYRLGIEF